MSLRVLESTSVPQGTKLICVGVGVGVGVGVEVTVAVGDGVGLGAALIATPLFHTSFVPDLIQVNFLPPAVAVAPALVHLAPAFTAAKVGAEIRDKASSRARNTRERVMR